MSRHLVNIFTNNEPVSLDAMEYIRHELIERGYTVTSEYSPDACLIICIGGDGAFLETVHNCDFPSTPILGINTGHLGFFQEIEDSKFHGRFHERRLHHSEADNC